MSWAVGQNAEGRWIGYGVPTECDHPDCHKKINRGMAYACGGDSISDPDEPGCGLFFCEEHLYWNQKDGVFTCERCLECEEPFKEKPDAEEWVRHMLTDESWQPWRDENPGRVRMMQVSLGLSESAEES